MKPILYAVIAVVLYGVQNVLIDVKLKQYSTIALLLGFYLVLLPLGLGTFIYLKLSGQPVQLPTGPDLKILAVVAVMFFIADVFYVSAYTSGGEVISITILAVLMPVVGGVVKYLWVKETPTKYHVVALVFAALAILFVAIGNTKKPLTISANETISTSNLR